ncbi:MAG TPA: DUF4185 domain-containing protein [Pirellulales bacterium]|nr:DUF4185 domain-containing protein [Pirellulales bacterium]
MIVRSFCCLAYVSVAVAQQASAAAPEAKTTVNSDARQSAVSREPRRIGGLRFLNDTIIRRKEFSGDNWHTTWAADGNQYVLQCDGRGFNTHLWRLVGQPPDFRFESVAEHPGPKEPPPARYYGFGILAVGDAIYHFYSTPDRWDSQPKKFIGTKLIYSPDGGMTWHNQNGSTPVVFQPWNERSQKNMAFLNEPGDSFSLLSMLQMGKAYQLNKDGYIYVYSPNGSIEGTMNQLVMFRVPKDKLLNRDAYEYFVAREPDGSAKWSRDINDRKPVYQFPAGWVNKFEHPYAWHPSLVYNAGLGVYMMANWGMGTDESGKWFVKPSYLGIWVANRPWGPWRQIHEDKAWFPPGGEHGGQCYQPQIMPGWIASDGKSFWLAWTQFPIGYYFQCQKVEIVTE